MIPTHDPHTVKSFDMELRHLNDLILRMGEQASFQLDVALRAVETGDLSLAQSVIEGDEALDRVEDAVNEQVIKVLALHSPVANDLRSVISSLSAAGALGRVADHAASTARQTEMLRQTGVFPAVYSAVRLGRLVLDQLREGFDAFIEGDTERALRVWERDSEVDVLYTALFRELLTYMLEDPRKIAGSIHLMMVAKDLERVGDHATTLAEVTWFVVKGMQICEARPKADKTTTFSFLAG